MNDINDLFQAHGNAVYSFCLYLAQNTHDGEDLFQDVMLRATQLVSKIDQHNNPKSYLFSIAVNLWKNMAQKRKRRNRIMPMTDMDNAEEWLFVDHKVDIEAEMIHKETRQALRRAIHTLDDKHRIPIILFYSSELKISEIADLLKKPQGTIKRLLFEAKAGIKREMEGKGYE